MHCVFVSHRSFEGDAAKIADACYRHEIFLCLQQDALPGRSNFRTIGPCLLKVLEGWRNFRRSQVREVAELFDSGLLGAPLWRANDFLGDNLPELLLRIR